MSRSNGLPPAHPGQRPQQWRQPEEPDPAHGWHPADPSQAHYGEPARAPAPHHGYAPEPPRAPPSLDPHAGYHYPPAAPPHPAAYIPQPPAPDPYGQSPQFDRYAPPPRVPAPPAWPEEPRGQPAYQPQPPAPPRSAYEALTGAGYGAPPSARAAQPGYDHPRTAPPQIQPDPRADLRGPAYDQWSSPQPDPHGYAQAGAGQPSWPQAPHDAGAHHPGHQEPALDLNNYGAPPPATYDGGRALAPEAGYEQEEYEEEEPPRRSRGLLIVVALVGAIGLGGGLAFAYKTFLAPSASSSSTPVVKKDPRPTKTQPADPGGKQFANRDSKVLDRLAGGPGGAQSDAAAEADGVKRVKSVAIGRDGTVADAGPPPSSAPVVANPLPGLTIVDGFAGGGRPGPQPTQGRVAIGTPPAERAPPPEVKTITLPPPSAEPQRAPQPTVTQQPRVAPTVGNLPPQKPAAAPPAAAPVAAAPPPAPKKPAIRTPEQLAEADARGRVAAGATAAAPVATGATAGGSNYVAVLASQRTSMEALKTFADLQQKYDVLKGRAPMVREANLGDKGVYHRLLVGPPGPRAQASALCGELKAAGYANCWITAVP